MIHYKTIMPQFIPALLAGTKVTTIRPIPRLQRNWPQPGDTIQFRRWSGKAYRSKQEEVTRVRVIGSKVVEVTPCGVFVRIIQNTKFGMVLVGPSEDVARRDGFASWAEMRAWFQKTHKFPFIGLLIEWEAWR